ncbi:PucR family transcriptional regulator [Nocardia sp. CA-151230]|uniref:PucR family transcriptional regulator n=1 Tax=Nocardia sp. CA-151230 TaxID=3239982 RepID=UPI003D94E6B8
MDSAMSAIVRAVTHEMLERRAEFAQDLTSATRARISVLDRDARMRTLLEASITENIFAVMRYLDEENPAPSVQAPAAALAYARLLAQRDIPLSALLRAYRIGHTRLLDTVMQQVLRTSGADSGVVIAQLVSRSAMYVDAVCEEVARAYDEERTRWVDSRVGLRRQWVERVLDGSVADVAEAEELLEYSLAGRHVAVVAWLPSDVPNSVAATAFDELCLLLRRALRAGERPLLVPIDDHEARIWFAVTSAELPDTVEINGAIADVAAPVRAAVGGPYSGVDGFGRSLSEAERVREVSIMAGPNAPRVIAQHQVAVLAMLIGEPNALRAFVSCALGELAVDSERAGRLRETLRVFLLNNRSYAAAAAELTMHRNTVQYRVQQALDLCSHTFDDPALTLDLQAALHAAHWLGSAVLRPG